MTVSSFINTAENSLILRMFVMLVIYLFLITVAIITSFIYKAIKKSINKSISKLKEPSVEPGMSEEISTSMSEDNILKFIDSFHSGDDGTLDTIFTSGCCYWFAEILKEKFTFATIVYHPVQNHFAAKIGGNIYDITGKLSDDGFVYWDTYPDPLEKERIVKQCILFTE